MYSLSWKHYTSLNHLQNSIDVVLGCGQAFEATDRVEIVLLPSSELKACTLPYFSYVPSLSYNLLNVSQASGRRKLVSLLIWHAIY